MKYLATINTPGYLPWDDDPPTFDTPREAWAYLAEARIRAEDDLIWSVGEDDGYSGTVNTLESLSNGTLGFEEVGDGDGTGSVHGDTPGYDGDHDLGLAYSVTVCEPCDGDHTVEWDGEECIVCGQATPMPETFTINERVLTNDTVTWAPDGCKLSGGHAALIVWHTFQNANSDEAHVKGFPSVEEAEAFIVERYGKTPDELIYGGDDEPEGGVIVVDPGTVVLDTSDNSLHFPGEE